MRLDSTRNLPLLCYVCAVFQLTPNPNDFNNPPGTGAMTLATVIINHSLPLMAACLLNNHLWGFLLSSALVVVFGEILPLMVFPRFPLLILGNMMWYVPIVVIPGICLFRIGLSI